MTTIRIEVQPRPGCPSFEIRPETKGLVSAQLTALLVGVDLPQAHAVFTIDRKSDKKGVTRSVRWRQNCHFIEFALMGYHGHFCIPLSLGQAETIERRLRQANSAYAASGVSLPVADHA